MTLTKNRWLAPATALRDSWQDFSQKFDNEPFGVLSLGSSMIRIAIFRRDRQNNPLLMGIGMTPSLGLKDGFITDLKACRDRVFLALNQAEKMAEYNLKQIAVLFSGPQPVVLMKKYKLSLGGAAVSRRHLATLNQKFWSPKSVEEYHLLYPIPFEYRLDSSPSLKNPLGLVGQNLSLTMAMIYEERHALQNIDGFLEKLNLPPSLLIDEAMAVALGMTSVDEQEMGALSIHIGAETINLAVIKNFCPIFMHRFNLGGSFLTKQLANALAIDIKTAEALKKNLPNITGHGNPAGNSSRDGDKHFSPNPLLPHVDMDKALLVVRDYLSQVFNQAIGILEKNHIDYRQLSVITVSGGGAKIKGLDELLKEKLKKMVRTTPTTDIKNLPPYIHGIEIAGIIGTALFIIKKQLNQQQKNISPVDFYQPLPKNSILHNIIAWAKRNYG